MGTRNSKGERMKNLMLVLIAFSTAACQVEPGTKKPLDTTVTGPTTVPPVETTPPTSTVQAPVIQPPVITPAPTNLTYFKLVKTVNPQPGTFAPFQLTAYCVQYQNNKYCWDDGLKTVTSYVNQHNGTTTNFFYSYWDACRGGCTVDTYSQPTLDSADFERNITYSWGTVAEVFTSGTGKTVTCTLINNGSDLDCVDFVLAL